MVNKIIDEIKKGLTGDPVADIQYLQAQGVKYKDHPKAEEILKILSDMSFDLLPEENKKQLKEHMFIGDKRVDQVFHDVNECIKKKNLDGAIELLAKIEEKADKHFVSTEKSKKFSFRNRLEEYIYTNLYDPECKYERTPFDFCQYLSAYGYLLIEKRNTADAVEKLEKAIKYNPVNVEPRFELAEAYKLLLESDKLIDCTRETLKIATTPYHISRCYTNLGYSCIEKKDYDSAVCFYYESLVYAKNNAVAGELQHIRAITGKTIVPPTREEVLAAFEKYDIPNGPNREIIDIAYTLGNYCMENNADPQESLFYMLIVYNLTRDKNVEKAIEKLNAQIVAKNAANESKE